MARLEGKAAIILGASHKDNMGQVMARRFLAEGARVVVAGRSGAELERFSAENGCAYSICDITKEDELAALTNVALTRYGRLDIAVNATGWGLLKPFLETTKAEIQQMVDLQFTGCFLFYQAILRAMQGPGSIIQISSVTASMVIEDHAAYMGAKAGADHVLRCVANEFGHRGIRANSIAPSFTSTPMTAKAAQTKGVIEAFVREYPLGRVGTSEDIADAAVWLSSDSCFVTGQVIQVNGGVSLRRLPRNDEIVASVRAAKAAQTQPQKS